MVDAFQAFISEVRKCSQLGYSKSHCSACEILTDLFKVFHQYTKPMQMTAATQRDFKDAYLMLPHYLKQSASKHKQSEKVSYVPECNICVSKEYCEACYHLVKEFNDLS